MSNTQVRILSGIVLVTLVGACVFYGVIPSIVAIGILGPFTIDEIITNFYGQPRLGWKYCVAQLSYFTGFIFFNFIQISQSGFSTFISCGMLINLILFIYLFFINSKKNAFNVVFTKTSWLTGFFVLTPLMCISYLLHEPNWRILLCGILLLNYMVDTAAYFSGKFFGKHKLWESVSPKKTVEGFIGGVLISTLSISLYWDYFVKTVSWPLSVTFLIIACCSQLGDLVQSKLKRQFEIKDSSSLIPGHGGVYDRIDSLLFVAPLFATLVSFYFH